MRCPVCGTPLIVIERDSVEVDYCIECHGLWFDEGEIEVLGEKAGMNLDLTMLDSLGPSASGERYRRCPRCTTKMRKSDLYRGEEMLVVDFCPKRHGIWFDPGEMGKLLRTAERTSDPTAEVITRFLGETFEPERKRSGGEA